MTGRAPFTGDSALSIAYQRLDHDVPPASAVIGGVPPQLDGFVARATARDPADRYADAIEMATALDVIAKELGLPDFRVPTPSNSAQHRSAELRHSQLSERPVHHPTRQLTRGPGDWSDPARRAAPEAEPDDPDHPEYDAVSGEFAGIPITDFIWERSHARRMVLVWVALVLAVTGLAATVGWTIGSNLTGLL